MQRSAICSEPGSRAGRRRAAALVALAIGLSAGGDVSAKVFMTQEEALKAAFPGEADVKRQTAYLTDRQASEAGRLAGTGLASRVVTYYSGRAGTAWFDAHVVRTLSETIMVKVTPEGTIARVDILSFNEPEEYLPRSRWFQQLGGHGLDEDLSLRRGVRPVTGATLSARAIVSACRRVLALHQVIVRGGATRESRP